MPYPPRNVCDICGQLDADMRATFPGWGSDRPAGADAAPTTT
jgi:hypothetical protein